MLNGMIEKKKQKPIEFRIVRSSLFHNTRTTQISSSLDQKTEKVKEDQIMTTPNLNLHKKSDKNVYFKLLSSDDNTICLKKTNRRVKNSEKVLEEENNNKRLLKKRMRNPSTNTHCSIDDENILDYDRFLEEMQSKTEESKKTEKYLKNKSENLKKKINCVPKQEIIIKKKIKKKSQVKRNSNVYDIDNFIIQNNAIRIHQRHERLDIPIPVFKEISLTEDFDKSDEEKENIHDELYVNIHQIYEKREREYCLSFYKKKKDKEKDINLSAGLSLSDHLTAKSNEDTLNSHMKIRINFNILSTGKVKI